MTNLTTTEVIAIIAEINDTVKSCEALTARVRALCPHEEYVEGLSIVACVQPILICKACGLTKPIDFTGNGFVVTNGN